MPFPKLTARTFASIRELNGISRLNDQVNTGQ